MNPLLPGRGHDCKNMQRIYHWDYFSPQYLTAVLVDFWCWELREEFAISRCSLWASYKNMFLSNAGDECSKSTVDKPLCLSEIIQVNNQFSRVKTLSLRAMGCLCIAYPSGACPKAANHIDVCSLGTLLRLAGDLFQDVNGFMYFCV